MSQRFSKEFKMQNVINHLQITENLIRKLPNKVWRGKEEELYKLMEDIEKLKARVAELLKVEGV